jgi:dihydrofolate reductase
MAETSPARGKVILGMAMSLDGFVSDRNGDLGSIYRDFGKLMASEVVQEYIRTTGAVVMGRRAYDMAQGDFTGYEFQVPIFVLSHDVPNEVAKGENERLSFTFVPDGIERAIELATAAAGDKDVVVIGGASSAQQGLRAGLVDEIEIDVAPILLGEGLRLFDNLGAEPIELERIRVIADDWFTHLRFRVVK